MKRLIILVFVLGSMQLLAQINPEYISPVKVGSMNLQTGKVYYQNSFNGTADIQRLAEKFKSKEQVFSVFNINSITSTEIKGSITNFQLNIDQYGVNRKKLISFLTHPLNAVFNIEVVDGRSRVTVSHIWFKNLPGEKSRENHNLEGLVTSKNATVFNKDKKNLKSITVIEKNLNELFTAVTGSGVGF